mgnify:CR=1 FL=1
MSSKRQLLSRHSRPLGLSLRQKNQPPTSICPFCSLAPATRTTTTTTTTTTQTQTRQRRATSARRHEFTTAAPSTNPRFELEQTLIQLKNEAPGVVNLSRLQLALQGLQQAPGEEAVRIAILGVQSGGEPGETAKRLLRALLADPLNDRESWEDELNDFDPEKPLIIRLEAREQARVALEIAREGPLQELHIASPGYSGLRLELLLMNAELPSLNDLPAEALKEDILVPNVIVPSADHHISSLPTPVHKALLVGNGFRGASGLASLPDLLSSDVISAAANMPGLSTEKLDTDLHIVDVALADKAVTAFRRGPEHAREYERMWTASNLAGLTKWLREGLEASDAKTTKPVVRSLIASLLQNATAAIEKEQGREVSAALRFKNLPKSGALTKGLAQWAQDAHGELQSELDLAFTGRRWKRLGWWKLFWRVDDVAMLTNEMLSQRFLPTAEQELVYLTGRISGTEEHPRYSQPLSSRDVQEGQPAKVKLGSGEVVPLAGTAQTRGLPKWPGHIAFTRRYLQNETVPALQALAQSLVVQALGTSGVATSISALLWVSQTVSTVYEAGVFAAVGVVYSLARMQKKWESARSFWEGDVREEGRKAVRGAEESIAQVLEGDAAKEVTKPEGELAKARQLVARAENALARMK